MLTWTASSTPNVVYNVYRGFQSGQEQLYASGIQGQSYADTGIANGIWYFYKVSAVANGTESAMSNEAGWVLGQINKVDPPTNVSAAAQPGQNVLTWTPSDTANVTYSVYRGYQSGQETLYKSGLTGTSFTDSAVSAGTYYFYKMSATSNGLQSALSNEAGMILAQPNLPAGAVTTLTAVPLLGQNLLAWQWTGPSSATFNVYRGYQPGSETLYRGGVVGSMFSDTHVRKGIYYFYVVRPVVNGVIGAPSNEAGWVLAK